MSAAPSQPRERGDGEAAPFVSLRGVSYGYREGGAFNPVLQGVDGQVRRGELVALLGQSGSGKSSLLHLIAGLDRPDAGIIEIGGTRLDLLSDRDRTLFRRRRLGIVYQFFNLLPTLTVLENVALCAELQGIGAKRARLQGLALLAEVGLEDRAGSYPDRLSGGEQQRVAIARALANDPWLLLADEPTGNLDSATGERVLDLLDSGLRRRGKTLMIATHSRQVADRADRIWQLRDGRLTA